MARASIIVAAVVIIVIIIVAFIYFGTNYFGNNPPSPSPTPTPTSTATPSITPETVRNYVMYFISTNHSQAATYITDNINWTGGLQPTSLVGYSTYSYAGNGWNVTIGYPVVPNPIYDVNATYTSPTTHLIINWQGTYENGAVTEIKYTYTP
jgi:hypothetical protein